MTAPLRRRELLGRVALSGCALLAGCSTFVSEDVTGADAQNRTTEPQSCSGDDCGNASSRASANETGEFDPDVEEVEYLDAPEGYRVGVFADFEALAGQMRRPHGGANPGVRFMRWRDGALYVAVPGGSSVYADESDAGRVVVIRDADLDGRADEYEVVLDGLDTPNNLDFHDGYLYVATNSGVLRYRMAGERPVPDSKRVVVDFPHAEAYDAPTVTVLANDRGLWVRRSTAVAHEDVDTRFEGAITRCELDGSNCETYAEGLRNAVGMTFSPNGTLVVSENGAGHANRTYPPDEINVVEEGNHYGWPYCQGDNEPVTPSFLRNATEGAKFSSLADRLEETDVDCSNMTGPAVELQAHVAPLGVTFFEARNGMPDRFEGDLLVASHGSWGLNPPVGYKIIRVDWNGSRSTSDFLTGWKNPSDYENPRGRPVDVAFGPNGAMYVSDDKEGRIYVVWHEDME